MSEESLFAAALERTSSADQLAFLDRACAGDAALRERVARLLDAHERAFGILDRRVTPGGLPGDAPPSGPTSVGNGTRTWPSTCTSWP
jgi:hypothetical protein